MENKKEYNQLTLDVTELGLFSGLYETLWLNDNMDIDEVMELADMLGVDSYDIDVTIDCHEYLKAISELYCEMLESELDSKGVFEVESVYSPMYYNYDTDRIFISWSSDVLTIEEMESKLKELCDDNESRDDLDVECELWMDRGHEVYYNMVRYTYKDKALWFGMDSEDIEKVKG